MSEWVEWSGQCFSTADYLLWTRIEASAWTLADLTILFYLTRIANLFRSHARRRPHVVPYAVLGATILPALLVPVAPSGWAIFRLELCITLPHFAAMLYILVANLRVAPPVLAGWVAAHRDSLSRQGRRL